MPAKVLPCCIFFLVGCVTPASSDASDPCADGPVEGGCQTSCALDPNICADGFFCGSEGVCTAECSATVPCASAGSSCSSDGRCKPVYSGPGSDPNSEPCIDEIHVVIRDFEQSHVDFERGAEIQAEQGIVLDDLDADAKPIFNQARHTVTPFLTVESQESFDQWYRDVPGVNQRIEYTLILKRGSNGELFYDSEDEFPSRRFLPIDGQGFGNTEGLAHNFHFTLELHSQFTYSGGEVLTFRGDDDLFLFINGKKAIDLGGVHGTDTAYIFVDQLAAQLGITQGQTYGLDLFFAERKTPESNFRIETSIKCIVTEDVY